MRRSKGCFIQFPNTSKSVEKNSGVPPLKVLGSTPDRSARIFFFRAYIACVTH